MRPAPLLALLAVLATPAACSPSFDFQPWLVPVPDGTTLHGYSAAAESDRETNRIELIEELVMGGDGTEADQLFGRTPPRVALGADGQVYVLDARNQRVQVYDTAGAYQKTLGRRGQGPGEFQQPLEIWTVGDTLFVWGVVNRRITSFSAAGELLDSRPSGLLGGMITAFADGSLTRRITERVDNGRLTHFERTDSGGVQLLRFGTLLWPERVIDPPLAEIANSEPDAWWAGTVPPALASAADGTTYVSPFEEYQVFAFAPDGSMRWALQVAVQRSPIAQVEIDYHMANHQRRFPQRRAGHIDWPERQYALADIKVDGHGHVYVFPYVPKGTPTSQPRPVDVYSADGQRLFAGTISGRFIEAALATYNGPFFEVAWQVADGDAIWGLAKGPEDDWQVVRYRLREPF